MDVRAYADRIVIRQDGEIVAEHPRSSGAAGSFYDPWHYVPVAARLATSLTLIVGPGRIGERRSGVV